jgi:hypothetical protein
MAKDAQEASVLAFYRALGVGGGEEAARGFGVPTVARVENGNSSR